MITFRACLLHPYTPNKATRTQDQGTLQEECAREQKLPALRRCALVTPIFVTGIPHLHCVRRYLRNLGAFPSDFKLNGTPTDAYTADGGAATISLLTGGMPHYICRWPSGDVLLASVSSRRELNSLLEEKGERGTCRVARYHGPFVLELAPKVPGMPRHSSRRFKVPEPSGLLSDSWQQRQQFSDVVAFAADGSSEPAHKVVLKGRCPMLRSLTDSIQSIRLNIIPNRATLLAFLEYLYTDTITEGKITHHLHMAAASCKMTGLMRLCEQRTAKHLESEFWNWHRMDAAQQALLTDTMLAWLSYADRFGSSDLKDFLIHLGSRHISVLTQHSSWARLRPGVQQLIQSVALASNKPMVERDVPLGVGNPGQKAKVKLDADLYARAGGRLSESEWQNLQTHRAACQYSRARDDVALPMLIKDEELPLPMVGPDATGLEYELCVPMLNAHRHMMGSVTRYAFPKVDRVLESLRSIRQETPTGPVSQVRAARRSEAGAPPSDGERAGCSNIAPEPVEGGEDMATVAAAAAAAALRAHTQGLKRALVEDIMLYDDAQPLKKRLVRLVVAAESGDSEAAEQLACGSLPVPDDSNSHPEEFSDESQPEGFDAVHYGLVEEEPFLVEEGDSDDDEDADLDDDGDGELDSRPAACMPACLLSKLGMSSMTRVPRVRVASSGLDTPDAAAAAAVSVPAVKVEERNASQLEDCEMEEEAASSSAYCQRQRGSCPGSDASSTCTPAGAKECLMAEAHR